MEKNTITKEQLESKLNTILESKALHLNYVKECDQGFAVLQKKKAGLMFELTKLNGEERAIKELLSTFEPPKEDKK